MAGRAVVMAVVTALAVMATACADGDGVAVISATPPYGPLAGGTRIRLHGEGFATVGTGRNRVLVGGREAPLVAAIDATALDVVIPPGAAPGDAEIVVIRDDRVATATGLFHYSVPPTVTAAAPADVLYVTETTVTLTGTGFAAEGAAGTVVLVDGVPADRVQVVDDTTLTFTAPQGLPMIEPTVEVINRRGRGHRLRSFRYAPSTRRGLLLFPRFDGLVAFLDVDDLAQVFIAWNGGFSTPLDAAVLDERGDYWGMSFNNWGRVDFATQELETLLFAGGALTSMVRVGEACYAIDENTRRFGRFDRRSGQFSPIGGALPCCGSFALAEHGAIYFTAGDPDVAVYAIDPLTGAFGPGVSLVGRPDRPPVSITDMRFLGDTLYASTSEGTLVTIDAATGAVVRLPANFGFVAAIEQFVPR